MLLSLPLAMGNNDVMALLWLSTSLVWELMMRAHSWSHLLGWWYIVVSPAPPLRKRGKAKMGSKFSHYERLFLPPHSGTAEKAKSEPPSTPNKAAGSRRAIVSALCRASSAQLRGRDRLGGYESWRTPARRIRRSSRRCDSPPRASPLHRNPRHRQLGQTPGPPRREQSATANAYLPQRGSTWLGET